MTDALKGDSMDLHSEAVEEVAKKLEMDPLVVEEAAGLPSVSGDWAIRLCVSQSEELLRIRKAAEEFANTFPASVEKEAIADGLRGTDRAKLDLAQVVLLSNLRAALERP
jgi:hypothetical protein